MSNPFDAAGVLEWIRTSRTPVLKAPGDNESEYLWALGEMVGDASIVALSEATHGIAEPLEFRNRLFRYLVETKGFTAIAIESGIVESRVAHDYVKGSSDDLTTALDAGFSWTFGSLPQNRALLHWLRSHNETLKQSCKVNFYGFDVPGSPGNAQVSRGVDTAVTAALRFLASVDPRAAGEFHERLDPLLQELRFDFQRTATARGYDRLSGAQRNTLTAAIADVIALFERCERRYSVATSTEDYAWGYQAAIGARQTDNWLRRIPLHWLPSSEPLKLPSELTSFYPVATDARDRAQADNLEWIIERQNPLAKVMIYAHRYHLSMTPVKASWAAWTEQTPLGTYLRRRFGERLITIGHLIGRGANDSGLASSSPQHSVSGLIDDLAREVGGGDFLLDMRRAPPSVAEWLAQEHTLGCGQEALKLPINRAFDVLFYTDAVTPACGNLSV